MKTSSYILASTLFVIQWTKFINGDIGMPNKRTERDELISLYPELQTMYQDPTPEYLASLKDFIRKAKLPPSFVPAHMSTLIPDYGPYYFDPYYQNKRDISNRKNTNIPATSRDIPRRMTNPHFPKFAQGENRDTMAKRKVPVHEKPSGANNNSFHGQPTKENSNLFHGLPTKDKSNLFHGRPTKANRSSFHGLPTKADSSSFRGMPTRANSSHNKKHASMDSESDESKLNKEDNSSDTDENSFHFGSASSESD